MSENLKNCRVKVFCPKCQEVYFPKKKCSDIDGAYFGCSFPHILIKEFPELIPRERKVQYVPKIYGFKILGMNEEK